LLVVASLNPAIPIVIVLAALVLIVLLKAIRVLQEFERAVMFRLGRLRATRGPGLIFVWPIFYRANRVSLRLEAVQIPAQQVITKDNVSVSVDAVAYLRVVDAASSVVKVRNWQSAALLVSQTTLRSTLGAVELDQLLSERDRIDDALRIRLDEQTEPWGVKVERVEIRDVGLPESMKRAMARQAEAERERRAKIIAAEGEFAASVKLAEAAQVMATTPGAIHLRTLQTMSEISIEKNSTIIFPIPTEILKAFEAVSHIADADGNRLTPAMVAARAESAAVAAREALGAGEPSGGNDAADNEHLPPPPPPT